MMNCQHYKNGDPYCKDIDVSNYTDLNCTWGIYTFIFNHSITNQIDQFHMMFMFTIYIALYLYQCNKLYNCIKNQSKSMEFQLLFCIWTLVKILQISYTYIGFQVDQSKQWQLRTKKNPNDRNYTIIKQNYCDYQLFYESEPIEKCFVRYEINGFLLVINLYLTIIIIQMITFFWHKQICPSMFISIQKVLMNMYVPFRIKLIYLFFFIIDIMYLAYIFILWIFIDCTLHWPINEPIQYFIPAVTMLYFVYTIWNLHHTGERLYSNQKLIAICTTSFLLVRIIYLITFQFILGGTQIIDEYRKTPFLYFLILQVHLSHFSQTYLTCFRGSY